MRKFIAAALTALAIAACLFGLVGCGNTDKKDIQGVWVVDGTDVVVVYTESELKLYGGLVYEYSLDTRNGIISYTKDEYSGESSYEFSEDRQHLTITESDGNGGTTVTSFTKISDDITAEPGVGVDQYLTPEEPEAPEEGAENDGSEEGAAE